MMNAKVEEKRCLLSPQDLANKLSCSYRHVLRMNSRGKLPASIKIGKLIRWEDTAINNWIATGCNQKNS